MVNPKAVIVHQNSSRLNIILMTEIESEKKKKKFQSQSSDHKKEKVKNAFDPRLKVNFLTLNISH